MFTFYLTDSKLGSRLYLGDISQNTYLTPLFKNMNYCDVPVGSRYWQCEIELISFTVNSIPGNVNNLSSASSNSKIIFDSGTSYLIIPANDFIYLLPKFADKAFENRCGVTPFFQLICQCGSPKDFDDIVLNLIGGSQFKIKIENLIQYFPALKYQCRFEILIDVNMMNFWILGDSVLRDTLLSFDLKRMSVGWIQEIEKLSDSMIFSNTTIVNAEDDNKIEFAGYLIGGLVILAITYLFIKFAISYARSEADYHPMD